MEKCFGESDGENFWQILLVFGSCLCKMGDSGGGGSSGGQHIILVFGCDLFFFFVDLFKKKEKKKEKLKQMFQK